MHNKQSILELLSPHAVLRALTEEAKDSVPTYFLEHDFIRLTHFPFEVGRESRDIEVDGKLVRIERRKQTSTKLTNSIYLIDACIPLHISRHHFQIERKGSEYKIIDRYSACGLSVGEIRIGGDDTGGEISLKDGDIISVGAEDTPYLFEFITL